MSKQKYLDGVRNISNSDYHSSVGISRSALMKFKKSPYHYWYEYLAEEKEPQEQTQAMFFGELVHTLSLEPSEFDNRFVVAPSMDRRTKAGKETWFRFTSAAINQNLIIIKQEDVDLATKIASRVRGNTLVDSLLQDASIEHSIFFTHATTGIQCKVRPDIWNGAIVGDLKTTLDASYRSFQGSAYRYGYFLQAGMIAQALYSIDIEMEKFIFIAVEKEAPFALGIYLLDEESVLYGSKLFDDLMERFARCVEKNVWESYGIQNLCVPSYAKFDELVEVE